MSALERCLAAAVLAGCATHAPPLANRGGAPTASDALPCGAVTLADLDPERPSASISCRVVGREVYEGATLLLESGGLRALTAYDRRIPGPRGIRVGDTGRDVERLASEYTHVKCAIEDTRTRCLFESPRDGELYCDNSGVGGITLYFAVIPEARVPCCDWSLKDAHARDVLRDRRIVAVQVRDPDCSGD